MFYFKFAGGWEHTLETLTKDLCEYTEKSKKLLSYKAVTIGFSDGDIIIINKNKLENETT